MPELLCYVYKSNLIYLMTETTLASKILYSAVCPKMLQWHFEQVTAVSACLCIFIKPLNTLNHAKISGLLISEIKFHDRSSSHREAIAVGPRLDTGGCLRKLWDNISCSKLLSVKSMSGSECSLLWEKSTIRRPDMDLNSSVGMLVSWLCERSNTCKQVCIQLLCILCTEIQKRQMDKSALVCNTPLQLKALYYLKVKLNFLKMVLII